MTIDALDTGRSTRPRPTANGKFLFVGGEKFYVRGVTYGPFRPDEEGSQYGSMKSVDRDFAAMAANGVNAVRIYTVPPRWILDIAQQHDLYVIIGLPWEQHITFLDDPKRVADIVARVRGSVRACADHPAVLSVAIGNEIPASIVRWYGRERVERFLRRLYSVAKEEASDVLVTYVNYPTTEYLDLSFLDFVCFNVFLESQERLEAYLARLQNIAGERPLLLTEVGLDSRRNGEAEQARILDWQVRAVFGSGAAGVFVFSWTDEWHRGGYDIEDWDFGLTTRKREPKPALASVRRAFAEVPFPRELNWPHISVLVCTYNGHRTIRECIAHLRKLSYPSYEIIVVDDGSDCPIDLGQDDKRTRIVRVQNGGLSHARNIGLREATGEIVAYIDDDAYPDPHWLTYLAHTFMTTNFVSVGGPNLPPPGEGLVSEAVARSPGGPTEVLLSDREAEHIPGCNMAFRKEHLQEVGGFDARFEVAGDDVDICWTLQSRGWKIGFNPAAVVWHHRRGSVGAYWKQQKGYGKAESLLEAKWPEKYNVAGHPNWAGRVYGQAGKADAGRSRVFYGVWGTAPFQLLYQGPPKVLGWLPRVPEWYCIIAVLALISALGILWQPMLYFLPLLAIAIGIPLVEAWRSAGRSCGRRLELSFWARFKWRLLVAYLHLLQPLARLWGRFGHGMTPWRLRGSQGIRFPLPRESRIWSESWQSPQDWLAGVESKLRRSGAVVLRGGETDRWDLEAKGGLLAGARLRMGLEEHGAGRQLARFAVWPRTTTQGSVLSPMFAGLSFAAFADGSPLVGLTMALICFVIVTRVLLEAGSATGMVLKVLKEKAEATTAQGQQASDEVAEGDHTSLEPALMPLTENGLSKGAVELSTDGKLFHNLAGEPSQTPTTGPPKKDLESTWAGRKQADAGDFQD